MTAEEVSAVLAKAYPSPAFAYLEQVRNGTGYVRRQRYADAIAMGLWPSRGLHLHGFEIKTSRYDWLNELKNPAKSEEVQKYCHFWWLVTGNEGVAELAEVPSSWGWMAVDDGRLKTLKEAPQQSPIPPDLVFLASVLRNAATKVDDRDIEVAYRRGVQAGKKMVSAEELETSLQKLAHKADKIRRQVDETLNSNGKSYWHARLKPCITGCGAWVQVEGFETHAICSPCAEAVEKLREDKAPLECATEEVR